MAGSAADRCCMPACKEHRKAEVAAAVWQLLGGGAGLGGQACPQGAGLAASVSCAPHAHARAGQLTPRPPGSTLPVGGGRQRALPLRSCRRRHSTWPMHSKLFAGLGEACRRLSAQVGGTGPYRGEHCMALPAACLQARRSGNSSPSTQAGCGEVLTCQVSRRLAEEGDRRLPQWRRSHFCTRICADTCIGDCSAQSSIAVITCWE